MIASFDISYLISYSRLVTEWRIQKRVEEQFNAFIQGFHELRPIPQSDIDAVTNKADFRQNPGY